MGGMQQMKLIAEVFVVNQQELDERLKSRVDRSAGYRGVSLKLQKMHFKEASDWEGQGKTSILQRAFILPLCCYFFHI